MTSPWHGVLVATALPWTTVDGVATPDLDKFAEHVAWLAENGCDGVVPNGSLGEYQQLTDEQRTAVVRTAVEASPAGFTVMPGVAGYGSDQAVRATAAAAELGCPVVMLLPPNTYRANREAVLDHYRTVASVGLPVVAYNNPFDTKVDLTPDLLAELAAEDLIVAVKEFTGDVRRYYEIKELAPDLDVLIGSDDVVLELAIAGSPGWVAGYPNALPQSTVALYKAALAGDLATALPLYRDLHPLLRWDSKTEFVQAIKLSMDIAGRFGGPCRPPRLPLNPEQEATVRKATEAALAAGHR
jgi:1-pyrroline-4-hydroxy-2-carboxylate deaminase